jgi:N-acetylglucosaminyldiphosphoundecaprenol N-acetyl-beta-D-mannosaminyltransferase
MTAAVAQLSTSTRPPIAVMGVPFDHVTAAEAIARIESMVASRRPHYLVTANVDFLVQARRDVELRRILLDAHLVLCDGTPLLWASRLLGHPLPERVAGADLVPLLLPVAARKQYRLFLLGATPESAAQAVARLRAEYPELVIAGHYSPPFAPLLEMDHEQIQQRILAAKPDILFVSLGCPKQEKWIAMNYRTLGVPVAVGVGATIDFLAGQVRRAPRFMQRTGTEWLFRLAQEPRRLFRRYVQDLWVFGWGLLAQWSQLQLPVSQPARALFATRLNPSARPASQIPSPPPCPSTADSAQFLQLAERLDLPAVSQNRGLLEPTVSQDHHCLLGLDQVRFVDSAGVGFLLRLHKQLRAAGRQLVLVAPSPFVWRALRLMRLQDCFVSAPDAPTAYELLQSSEHCAAVTLQDASPAKRLAWHGEITAANAQTVWAQTSPHLPAAIPPGSTLLTLGFQAFPFQLILDLSDVPFMDSSGLALLVRAKKAAQHAGSTLAFTGFQPPVLNVLRLAKLEPFLLGH